MSMEAEREIARLWRVSRTAHEMVKDRGYLMADYELEQTYSNFKEAHGGGGTTVDRSNISFTADHAERGGADRIYVYFCADKTVSKAAMKVFIGAMERTAARHGIIIYSDKMSSVATKTMQELSGEYHLESFKEADLLVNITKHFLVPQHTILTPEGKAELVKRYRLKDTQLPRIMMTDPVAKYYGMRRGQVMKIDRKSETAGRYITYRICM